MGAALLSPLSYITRWNIAKLQWKVQALANILFGFSLTTALLRFLNFSWDAVVRVGIVYLLVYLLVFVPLFGILPVLLFRRVFGVIERVRRGERVEEEVVAQTIETLLNTPLVFSLILAAGALGGFALGVGIIRTGVVPELLYAINTISASGIALGLVVGMVHGFLNLIFFEAYVHPSTETLASLYPGCLAKITRLKRNSLFLKVFMLILFSTMAGVISLGTLFLSKIALSFPRELNASIFYAALTVTLSMVLVFVIAARFTLNITIPLSRLSRWSRVIAQGNLQERIPVVTNDEVFEVVSNVAQMVSELRDAKTVLEERVLARTKELQDMTEHLEAQVQERTLELQGKIDELERFQRLAVGRELKMVELKRMLNSSNKKI